VTVPDDSRDPTRILSALLTVAGVSCGKGRILTAADNAQVRLSKRFFAIFLCQRHFPMEGLC